MKLKQSCSLLISAVLLTAAQFTRAADEAGVVKTVEGTASILRDGQTIAAAPGAKVLVNDRLRTSAASSIGITLRDNTVLTAGANSTLVMDKFAFDQTTQTGTLQASVKRGTLAVISGKLAKASPEAVQFRTPTSILGVRGTEFIVEVGEGSE
jgi:hypothetical protein